MPFTSPDPIVPNDSGYDPALAYPRPIAYQKPISLALAIESFMILAGIKYEKKKKRSGDLEIGIFCFAKTTNKTQYFCLIQITDVMHQINHSISSSRI